MEQDLLLSRAICVVAEHEYLGEELVFRGGTALHKLHLGEGYRYSEDLDYVRRTPGGMTFHPAELVATKIRALYQRSKGRDLFDLWLALTEMALPPDEILASVGPYRPDGLTSAQAIANLRRKVGDPTFATDLDRLLATVPATYSVQAAAEAVIELLLARLDD